MTQNRLTLLGEMRPQTSLDAVWTAEEQKLVRERILADRTSPLKVTDQRRKRVALAGILAVGLVALPGVATAVGSGMKPQAFFDAYDYWTDNPDGAVDPKSAKRVATAQGPYGGTLSVLTSTNDEGLTCISPVFETATSAEAELPNDFEDGGSFCHTEPNTRAFGFNSLSVGASGVFWMANAGDAVTAELRMPTGETYPVVQAEGYLFGWYPLPYRAPKDAPTLIGYAADGSVVGEAAI